jgi:hypothetical protein
MDLYRPRSCGNCVDCTGSVTYSRIYQRVVFIVYAYSALLCREQLAGSSKELSFAKMLYILSVPLIVCELDTAFLLSISVHQSFTSFFYFAVIVLLLSVY